MKHQSKMSRAWSKLKLNRWTATAVAAALIATTLVIVAPSAEAPAARADAPTDSILLTAQRAADNVHESITATITGSSADAAKTFKLYVTGSTTPVFTSASDTSVTTQVSLPSSGYVSYFAKVDDTQSNTIAVDSAAGAWSVSLSSSATSYSTTGPIPTISWQTSQALGSYSFQVGMYVATEDGKIIYKAYSGTSGSFALPTFADAASHTYTAYLGQAANANTVNQIPQLRSASVPFAVLRQPWTVDLNLDKTTFSTTDATPRYTVTLNQPLYKSAAPGGDTSSSFSLYVYDRTTGTLLTQAGGYRSDGQTVFTGSINAFYSGNAHSYVAYVAQYSNNGLTESQLTNVQAVSGVVSATRQPWSLDLTLSKSSYDSTQGSGTPVTYTATMNQQLDAVGTYMLYVYNKTTGALVATMQTTTAHGAHGYTGSTTGLEPGDSNEYVAYVAQAVYNGSPTIAQLTNIQAISPVVSTSRTGYTLDASASAPSFTSANPTPTWTAVTNQPIYSNTGDNSGSIAIYTFDLTTNTYVSGARGSGVNNATTFTSPITRFTDASTHMYRSYVARYLATNPTSPSDLTRIYATSGTFSISRPARTLSLDQSKATYTTEEDAPSTVGTLNMPMASQYEGGLTYYVFDESTDTLVTAIPGSNAFGLNTSLTQGSRENMVTPGDTSTYRAYVAAGPASPTHASQLTGVVATSGTVTSMRVPWTLSLASGRQVRSDGVVFDNLDATLNQAIHGYYSGGYKLYFFNTTTGALVGRDDDRDGYITSHAYGHSVTVPANSSYSYIAYIAAPQANVTSASQLTDIRAISNVSMPSISVPGPTGPKETVGGGSPNECSCQASVAKPVNTYNGEEFENVTDLSIANPLAMDFARSYSSKNGSVAGPLGNGWSMNWNMRADVAHAGENSSALVDATQVQITQENGSTNLFNRSPDGSYLAPYRVFASLAYDSAQNQLVMKRYSGESFYFSVSTGNLVKVKNRNGDTLNLSYAQGHLSRVDGSDNKFIEFTWTGSLITEVSDYAGRSVSYGYDTDDNLTSVSSVSSANGYAYTYEPTTGLLATITDPDGGVTTNTYVNGKVTEQERPDQSELKFTYNSSSTDVKYPDNTVIRYSYNDSAQLTSVTAAYGTPEAATTSYTYSTTGQKATITDPLGHVTSNAYDGMGNLIVSTDARQHATTYTYNGFGEVTSTTHPDSGISHNYYDTAGRLTSAKDFEGKETQYEYDSDGRLSKITAPNEIDKTTPKKTQLSYDAYGFLDQVTAPEGGITQITNNDLGNPTDKTDAAGKLTQYDYDSYDRVHTVTAPNGGVSTTTYYASGMVHEVTDPLGRVTTYVYDELNRVKKMTTDLGDTNYTYDDFGRTLSVTDYANRTTSYSYDLRGNTLTVEDPNHKVTTSAYDLADQLTSVEDARHKTTSYEYDENGNLISTTDPRNSVSTATYDSMDRQANAESADGVSEVYTYDKNGRLTKTTYADNTTAKSGYDDNGNVHKTTDQNGTYKTYEYDADNNLLSYTDETSHDTSHTYNNADQLISTTQPDNTVEKYNYTNMGQLHQTSFDNFQTIDTQYSYNLVGQVTDESKTGVATEYRYDPLGNLTYRGPPVVGTDLSNGVSYQYNTAQQIEKEIYPSGVNVDYTYGASGNLLTVKRGAQDVVSYTYDDDYNITEADYGNGVVDTRSYDGNNQLSDQSIVKGSNNLYSKNATYTKDGLIKTAATQTAAGTSTVQTSLGYAYDNLERLQTVTKNGFDASYAYDNLKNLVSSPQSSNTYNALSQITTANTSATSKINYAYDARGNRTSAVAKDTTDPQNELTTGSTVYSWTKDNTLSEVQSGNKDISYTYDASGLLATKDVTGFDSATLTAINSHADYVWDENARLPLLLEDGGNSYVYGASIAPVAQIDNSTGAVSYLQTDDRGSVVLLTDGTGAPVASYSYDTYGNTESTSTDTGHALTAFAYVGLYFETDTSLFNLRARWYDSTTGSFLSLDPKVLATHQAYAYGLGNPALATDPTGLSSGDSVAGGGRGVWDLAFGFATGTSPHAIDFKAGDPMTAQVQNDTRTKAAIAAATKMVQDKKYNLGKPLGTKNQFYHNNGGAKQFVYDAANVYFNAPVSPLVVVMPTTILETPLRLVNNAIFPYGWGNDMGLTYLGGYSMNITPTAVGPHCAVLEVTASNVTSVASLTRNPFSGDSFITNSNKSGMMSNVTENFAYTQVVRF